MKRTRVHENNKTITSARPQSCVQARTGPTKTASATSHSSPTASHTRSSTTTDRFFVNSEDFLHTLTLSSNNMPASHEPASHQDRGDSNMINNFIEDLNTIHVYNISNKCNAGLHHVAHDHSIGNPNDGAPLQRPQNHHSEPLPTEPTATIIPAETILAPTLALPTPSSPAPPIIDIQSQAATPPAHEPTPAPKRSIDQPAPPFRKWKLNGKYEPMNLYSPRDAAMIKTSDGHGPALGIMLSRELASRIQNALCAGRDYREIKNDWEMDRR